MAPRRAITDGAWRFPNFLAAPKSSEPLRGITSLLVRILGALSACGRFRRNGTPAPGLAASASFARSAYAYTPSGASPAESAHALKQSVPLAAAKSPAHVTFWPWCRQSRPHPSLRAEPCALPRHPRPIRVAWLRRGIPLLASLAPRRVCREPAARRRPAFGLRPRLPTPTQLAVAFARSPPLRAPA